MRVLSLFSGGGLGDYGLTLAGMEIVGQVEIDDYCQKILNLRWPDVPKWRDIRDVRGEEVIERCGAIDLISGGFPCQPFSFAGNRKGKEDNRYLWPEMFRVISEVKPAYVLGENVFGIIRIALDSVLSDLESIGYTCQSFVIPACSVDAPHRRDRVWILAYCGHNGRSAEQKLEQEKWSEKFYAGCRRNVAYAASARLERLPRKRADIEGGGIDLNWAVTNTKRTKFERVRRNARSRRSELGCGCWWEVEPNVGRVAHGVANRVDRLKLLGNGQVVQVVEWIGKQIMKFEKEGVK